MTLSGRDWRILKAVEEEFAEQDRALVARFARLGDARRPGLVRRRWKIVVALLCWVGLVCADAAAHQVTLLWIALSAGAVGTSLLVWRRRADKPAPARQGASSRYLNS